MRSPRIIAALIVTWPALVAAGPVSVEALVESGRQARERGELQESLQAFEAAAAAAPNDTDVLLYLGLVYAQTQRADAARQTLTRAADLDPRRTDVRKALARSDLWAGQHAAAQHAVNAAIELDRNDVEAWLLSAQIALARHDLQRAAADLHAARALAANDPEVLGALAQLKLEQERPLEALELLDGAERSGNLTAALRDRRERLRQEARRWRYSLNLSHSDFSAAGRDPWREAFQQLDWRWTDDTEVQARLETSERFGKTDTFLALGVARRFAPFVRGYLQVGGTPSADFRERTSVLAGASMRFDHARSALPATVATFDLRLNEYATGHVETYQPGIEQYFNDGRWWLSGRGIFTNDEHGKWQNGWLVRGDVALTDKWSSFVGYSDAPETSGSVTLESRTAFAGMTLAITSACAANVSYAREDRPDVYVRKVVTAGAACRL